MWNPITSPQTRKVEAYSGATIYRHSNATAAGKFITVFDALNWATAETVTEARDIAAAGKSAL